MATPATPLSSRPRRGPRVASYYDNHEFAVVRAPTEKDGRYHWPQVEVAEQAGKGRGLRAVAPLPTNTVLPYGGCIRRPEEFSSSEKKKAWTKAFQIKGKARNMPLVDAHPRLYAAQGGPILDAWLAAYANEPSPGEEDNCELVELRTKAQREKLESCLRGIPELATFHYGLRTCRDVRPGEWLLTFYDSGRTPYQKGYVDARAATVQEKPRKRKKRKAYKARHMVPAREELAQKRQRRAERIERLLEARSLRK